MKDSISGVVRPRRTNTGAQDLDALRSDVRAWCAEHVPTDWRMSQTGADPTEFVRFQQWWLGRLRAAGLAVPHWPKEYGGGFSVAEQAVIFEELARADAPRLVLQFVSIHHAAATLIGAGTDAQRARHLPAIVDGQVWCQAFSEPEAGSDLAALRARAVRKDGSYVVNGQKTWSSLAMYADWCLLLARTDPKAPKREGISYFLLDMRSPGVEVRPIRQPGGEAHFGELFLTDVNIPAENRIGQENDGWRIAQTTLTTERGATMVELAERLSVGYDWLVDATICGSGPDGCRLIDDAKVRDDLAWLATQVQALRLLTHRAVTDADSGAATSESSASVIKLYYSELLQRLTEYGVQLSGLDGQREAVRPGSGGWESGVWLADFLASWEWTIPGGTSEIQRSIIGERGLGLPKEPRPA